MEHKLGTGQEAAHDHQLSHRAHMALLLQPAPHFGSSWCLMSACGALCMRKVHASQQNHEACLSPGLEHHLPNRLLASVPGMQGQQIALLIWHALSFARDLAVSYDLRQRTTACTQTLSVSRYALQTGTLQTASTLAQSTLCSLPASQGSACRQSRLLET